MAAAHRSGGLRGGLGSWCWEAGPGRLGPALSAFRSIGKSLVSRVVPACDSRRRPTHRKASRAHERAFRKRPLSAFCRLLPASLHSPPRAWQRVRLSCAPTSLPRAPQSALEGRLGDHECPGAGAERSDQMERPRLTAYTRAHGTLQHVIDTHLSASKTRPRSARPAECFLQPLWASWRYFSAQSTSPCRVERRTTGNKAPSGGQLACHYSPHAGAPPHRGPTWPHPVLSRAASASCLAGTPAEAGAKIRVKGVEHLMGSNGGLPACNTPCW